MSPGPAPTAAALGAPARERSGPRPLGSAALVVGFWWIATGGIVALQRPAISPLLHAVLLAGLVAGAVALIRRFRTSRSVAACRWLMLAGGMLWAAASLALYGGLLGGSGTPAVSSGPSWPLAWEALGALWSSELAALAVVALAAVLSRSARNRTALLIVGAFWTVQQLAKLNVFFGVAYPAADFLPRDLAFVASYFGPARNSPLLPVSLALLCLLTALLARRSAASPEPARAHGLAMVSAITALAAVELLLLGIPSDLPVWDIFLSLRGSG